MYQRLPVRQINDPTPVPTGISGVVNSVATVNTAVATSFSSLAVDTTGQPLAHPSPTLSRATSVTPTSTPSQTPVPATAASNGPEIPLAVVVGSCIGSFFALVGLLFLVLFLQRRCTKRKSRRPVSHLSTKRNERSEQDRSRLRRESWQKLEDDKPKADLVPDPSPPTKEVDDSSVTSKFDMFKKNSESLHSFNRSLESTRFDDKEQFAHYPPTLLKHLTKGADVASPSSRTGLLQLAPVSPLSWDLESDSRYTAMTKASSPGSSLPPSYTAARPTPPITKSPEVYRGESAEIVHYYQSAAAEPGRKTDVVSDDFGWTPSLPSLYYKSGSSLADNERYSRERTSASTNDSSVLNTTKSDPPSNPPGAPSREPEVKKDQALRSLLTALETPPPQPAPLPGQSRLSAASTRHNSINPSVLLKGEGSELPSAAAFPMPPPSLPRVS